MNFSLEHVNLKNTVPGLSDVFLWFFLGGGDFFF